MKKLKNVSYQFLRGSKLLSLSCIFSILFATMSIIIMVNFVMDIGGSYANSEKAMFGDGDILVSCVDDNTFSESDLGTIGANAKVDQVAAGKWAYYNIEDSQVYCVGVDGSKLMQSRYGYENTIKRQTITINQVLSEYLNKKAGDQLTLGEKNFTINEVLDSGSSTGEMVMLAVLDQQDFNSLLKAPGNSTNCLFIKAKSAEHISEITEEINSMGYKASAIQEDPELIKLVQSTLLIVAVIAAMVLFVSALFTASVFKNFLKKYNRDMAIIRVMGGSQKQVSQILNRQLNILLLIGSGLGFLFAAIFYTYGLGSFSSFIDAESNSSNMFHIVPSIMCLIFIWILLKVVIKGVVSRHKKMAPVQVLYENSVEVSGNRDKSHRTSNLLEKIKGYKNLWISITLLAPKLKANRLLIMTVATLIIVTVLGSTFIMNLKDNGARYLKDSYLTDIVVTDASDTSDITLSSIKGISEQLNEADGVEASALTMTTDATYQKEQESTAIFYQGADIKTMQKQGIVEPVERVDNAAIIGSDFAKEHHLQAGDEITLQPYGTENTKPFQVAEIYDSSERIWAECIIDWSNEEFVDKDSMLHAFYLSGDQTKIESTLFQLKQQYPTLKWGILQEELQRSDEQINKRYGLFMATVWGLIVVMGIGWINSLSNILEERRNEYNMLRILGLGSADVTKVIFYQILMYLAVGIGSGFLCSAILTGILDLGVPSLKNVLLVAGFMLVITLPILPKTIGIVKEKKLLASLGDEN